MAEWYVKNGEREHGPLSSRDLIRLAKANKIVPDSLVRKGLEGKWSAARTVTGLFGQPAEDTVSPASTSDPFEAAFAEIGPPLSGPRVSVPIHELQSMESSPTYIYRMVQVPPSIVVPGKGYRGDEAADYLQSIVNREARQGWEFYRVDSIGVEVPPGCLGLLFGQRAKYATYHVITFRLREKQG